MSSDNNEMMTQDGSGMTLNEQMAALELQAELRRRRLNGETHYEGIPIDILTSNDEEEEREEATETKTEKEPIVESAVRRIARIHRKMKERRQALKDKVETRRQEIKKEVKDHEHKDGKTNKLSFRDRFRIKRELAQINLAQKGLMIKKAWRDEMERED